MILKYDEYIKEGLWAKGIERSKTGKMRKEELDMFNDMYDILPDWFCNDSNQIYHSPNKKPVAQFADFIITGDGTYQFVELEYFNNITNDEKNIINSDEFKEEISIYFIPF